jgi:hypothetical protein
MSPLGKLLSGFVQPLLMLGALATIWVSWHAFHAVARHRVPQLEAPSSQRFTLALFTVLTLCYTPACTTTWALVDRRDVGSDSVLFRAGDIRFADVPPAVTAATVAGFVFMVGYPPFLLWILWAGRRRGESEPSVIGAVIFHKMTQSYKAVFWPLPAASLLLTVSVVGIHSVPNRALRQATLTASFMALFGFQVAFGTTFRLKINEMFETVKCWALLVLALMCGDPVVAPSTGFVIGVVYTFPFVYSICLLLFNWSRQWGRHTSEGQQGLDDKYATRRPWSGLNSSAAWFGRFDTPVQPEVGDNDLWWQPLHAGPLVE